MKKLAGRILSWASGAQDAAAEAVSASAGRCAQLARELAPVDSGELRSGIHVRVRGRHGADVVSSAAHSAMVEFGTSKMPPRPYMQPAAQAAREDYFSTAKRLIQGRDKT